MQSSHRCNWDWCRETFSTERGLAQHLNVVHFKNIAVVKKEDWHVWVKTQTGQSQPDSSLDGLHTTGSSFETGSTEYSKDLVPGTLSPTSPRSHKPELPSSSPRIPQAEFTPPTRRRQSFSAFNEQSSPTPPLSSNRPSPTLSDMISNKQVVGLPDTPAIVRHRSFRSHGSSDSVEDVETQLTQARSPNSSFASSAHVKPEVPSRIAENPPQQQSWKNHTFKFRPATKSRSRSGSQSQSQARAESEVAQGQNVSQDAMRGEFGYSQLPLQTQAPYFSQSIDSQGDSQ